MKSDFVFTITVDLISAARLLCSLCIKSCEKTEVKVDMLNTFLDSSELKYRYALVETFNQNGFDYIIKILDKICDSFLRPSHRNLISVSQQGKLTILLFEPCLKIIKHTIFYLANCRLNEFKDTSSISTLLKVYSLMLQFPPKSPFYDSSVEICSTVLDTLLCYIQVCLYCLLS